MTDETKNQQGDGKKDGSTVESKHAAENIGRSEGGLPGQGQKGENERKDSKRAS